MPRAEREQQILDVAGGVFAGAGFHAAQMDEIARLAGVSKPMLYAYFNSKEGLYVAYIERAGGELVERLQHALAEGDPRTVRPDERIDAFLAFVEEHRDGWTILFTEANTNRPVAEQVAALRRRIVAAVRRLVIAGGGADAGDRYVAAEVAAAAIVGAGESLANWWLAHPDVPRERVATGYAAVIRGAITPVGDR